MTSDPAYLRAFKNFAKRPPTLEESEAMEKEFYGESDRACGVLHASWVEQVLETAIRRRLRPNLSNRMFDFEGPLGTFSAKIMMGYALGLFGSKTNHDLLLIRTIRNEFAHCQLPLRFDLPEVKAVCDQLIVPDTEAKIIPSYFYRSGAPSDFLYDHRHPKARFVICCHSIIHRLFDEYKDLPAATFPETKLP